MKSVNLFLEILNNPNWEWKIENMVFCEGGLDKKPEEHLTCFKPVFQ